MKLKAVAAAVMLVLCSAAHAQGRHVHGEGRLDVAIEMDRVSLSLELPLDAAVGFERAPKTDKEKAALAAAGKTLRDAAALWVFAPAAQCALESAKVGLPKFDGEHADIEAGYVFRCANAGALRSIETTLFRQFRRLHRIDVQRSGPAGQGAARLTPKNPVLGW